MLIEFQTTGTNYLYQFREALKAAPLVLIDEQPSDSRVLIINRVVIGNQNQLRAEKTANFLVQLPSPGGTTFVIGKRTQVVQPVTIELVYLDELLTLGDVAASVTPLQVWVVFDLALTVSAGVAFLAVDYDSVEGFLPPDVLGQLDARLRAAIKRQSTPVDLSSVQDIIGGLQVVNAGIACRPGAGGPGNVALRVELGTAESSADQWQRFFNGSYDVLLGTPGKRAAAPVVAPAERWAIFLDKSLLERFVTNLLQSSFTDSKDLRLRSDITVGWSNPNGDARLDASFKAIAINACDLGPLGQYDIRLDVQIPITLSVPSDNTLRQHLKINYWKNDLDTAACVIGVSVFWPLIGAAKVSGGKLRWDFYAWLVVLVPLRFVAAIVKANSTKLDPPKQDMKKVSDDEFESDQDFSKAKPLILLDYRGLSTGLVLLGRQPAEPDTCPALIGADHCGFEYKPPHIECSEVAGASQDQLQHQVTKRVFASATATIQNVGEPDCRGPGKIPLQLWQWRFLDDALAKQLQLQVIEDDYVDAIALQVICPIPPDSYFVDPHPIQLLVKTNGGARAFTFRLTKASQAEIDHLALTAAVEAVGRCEQLVDPWWQHFHHFNPKWSVDPPFAELVTDRQVWVMTFAGLAPGDQVSISANEQRVMTARADARGQAMLTAMTSGTAPAPVELAYRPAAPGDTARAGGSGQMFMSQALLATMGEVELSAPVVQLIARAVAGRRLLYALHSDGFSVVDASFPEAPVILAEQRGDAFRGAAVDERGLLLLAGTAPVRVSPEGIALPARTCSGERAVAALAGGGRYYLIGERSLTIFDDNLCQSQHIDLARPAACAALVGERVAIGGPEGLTLFDPNRSEAGVLEFEVGAIDALSAPAFGAPDGTVLVRSGDRRELLALPEQRDRERRPEALAEYDTQPWFDSMAPFESYLGVVTLDKVSLVSIVGRVRPCSS